MKKSFVSALASVVLLASLASTSMAATASFVDIQDSYAKEAIVALQAKGIINGMDDTHFEPNSTLNRAQFTAIIVRALGLEAKATTSSFTDVTDWSIPFVEAAFKAGIVDGVGTKTFDPNASVTREQAVTILVRSLKTKGKLDETATVNFTDADKISDWAKPYIAIAQKYNLISGLPDGSFDPQGVANRAMAAIMGQNLLSAVVKVASATPAPTTQEPTTQEPTITTPTTPVFVGGGGGGGRRNNGNRPEPRPEVPTVQDGKATFSNGTTVEGLPAGATIAAKVVTVTAIPGIQTAGQAMDFTFTGTMPTTGVVLRLPTTSNEAGLSYFNPERNKWELQADSTVEGNFVKATVHHFSTYGPVVKSAQLIADSITGIKAPEKDERLTLPTVADGFTVAIKSSDKPDVIALDGRITPPSVETTVALVLEVTKTADGSKAATVALTVVVPAKTVVAPVLSNIATVTSTVYVVSSGGTANETVTNVTYGTSKADFLKELIKGDINQTWDISGIHDPVVTGDKLIVTAQDGKTTVTYAVTINGSPTVAVTGVTLDQPTLTMKINATPVNLVATISPTNATNKAVTWSSSDTSVASVVDGKVTPHTEGKTNITVTTMDGNYTASSVVTVLETTSPIIGEHATLGLIAQAYDNDEGLEGEFADYIDTNLSVNEPLSKLEVVAYAGNHENPNVPTLKVTGTFSDITKIEYSTSYRPNEANSKEQLDTFFRALNFAVEPEVVITATDLAGNVSTKIIPLVLSGFTPDTIKPTIGQHATLGLIAQAYDNLNTGLTGGFADYIDTNLSVNEPLQSLVITAYAGDPTNPNVPTLQVTGQVGDISKIEFSTSYGVGEVNSIEQLDTFFRALNFAVEPKVVIVAKDVAGNESTITIPLVLSGFAPQASQYVETQDFGALPDDGFNLGFKLNLDNLGGYSNIKSITGTISDSNGEVGKVAADTPVRINNYASDDADPAYGGNGIADGQLSFDFRTATYLNGNTQTDYTNYITPIADDYTGTPTSVTIVIVTQSGAIITINTPIPPL